MKYLVSVPKERSQDRRWTTEREPVVPCFPSQHIAAFLTVPSFLLADRAVVAEVDADPDALADALAKEYPGLPRRLHENYVLKTFEAVFGMPEGTVLRAAVSQAQARLVDDRTGAVTMLWEKQPL